MSPKNKGWGRTVSLPHGHALWDGFEKQNLGTHCLFNMVFDAPDLSTIETTSQISPRWRPHRRFLNNAHHIADLSKNGHHITDVSKVETTSRLPINEHHVADFLDNGPCITNYKEMDTTSHISQKWLPHFGFINNGHHNADFSTNKNRVSDFSQMENEKHTPEFFKIETISQISKMKPRLRFSNADRHLRFPKKRTEPRACHPCARMSPK